VARYLTQLRGGAGGAGQPAPQQYASGDGDIAARVGNLEAARQAERDHGKRQALGIELY